MNGESMPQPGPQGVSVEATRSIELVREAQGGDLEALNRLFARYYQRVQRIVRIRLGQNLRRNLDSGDILQETFIAAVEAFDRFEVRDPAGLIHWFSRIAEHRIRAAAEHFGRQKRDARREVALRHVLESQRSGELTLEPAASMAGPLSAMVHAENMDDIEDCLGELKEESREVILLRDYAGGSWEAVAELIGAPSASAARMRYSRAITELAMRIRRRQGS